MATAVDFGKYKRLVQDFWDPKPMYDAASSSPIWCLGQAYQSTDVLFKPNLTSTSLGRSDEAAVPAANPTTVRRSSEEDQHGWPSDFLDDFEARLWFTYRSGFPPIPKSADPKALSGMSIRVRITSQLGNNDGFVSDTGWGCMIRSGQSLLGNALLTLKLGRDWRRNTKSHDNELLTLFCDHQDAPFSVHRFVQHGAEACGKHPGQWFGPSAIARCIQALVHERRPAELKVYVTGDGADVYEDKFMEIAKEGGSGFMPTLVLVGTRLGLDKITPVYWEALKATLQMPQSIGIAGGRPSSSHYFVGTHGLHLFYLDPHQTQPALSLPPASKLLSDAEINTCHTRRLRRIHVKDMDPSMLIAFLIRDEEDWKKWRKGVQEVQGKAVIRVADRDPGMHGTSGERSSAIDEVESFDEDDGEDTPH